MCLPTANTICEDVENRLILLGRLFDREQNLTDEEWGSLVYYDQRNPIARRRFIEAIEEIRSGYHNRIMNDLADPYSALDQIDDLTIALDDLKRRFFIVKPEVIDNIAVDEALEKLGRAMGPNE